MDKVERSKIVQAGYGGFMTALFQDADGKKHLSRRKQSEVIEDRTRTANSSVLPARFEDREGRLRS